jgi:transcriptional regulator
MLEQPIFLIEDPAKVRELVRAHAWATLVSHVGSQGLVVSHLPVLVDESEPELAIVSHLARVDGETHELGDHDVVVVVEGPNGYLSPSWYGEVPHVPTWDFVVVHLHGRPEVLGAEETYRILSDTVDHFERVLSPPWELDQVEEYAHRIAGATVGFRLRPRRVVAKAKLSQDESPDLVRRAATMLRTDGPYRQPDLAAAMMAELPPDGPPGPERG